MATPETETLQPASAGDHTDNAQTQQGSSITIDAVFQDMKDASEKQGMGSKLGELAKDYEAYSHKFQREVTDEDRKDAKADLADELGELVEEPERKNLLKAQAAIIDGDPAALAEVFKAYADNPAMLAKIVKELDRELTHDHAGTHLAINKDGNVFLYGQGGKVAMEFSPADGLKGLHPIQSHPDGSMTLLPGEILGADPAKVAKGIGDDATRRMTGGDLIKIPDWPPMHPPVHPPHPGVPGFPHVPKPHFPGQGSGPIVPNDGKKQGALRNDVF